MEAAREVSGKRFTVLLMVGFVIFTLVMAFGTYGLGQLFRTQSSSKMTLEALRDVDRREGR
jgi:hydrogenase/urease accessory protein HupE